MSAQHEAFISAPDPSFVPVQNELISPSKSKAKLAYIVVRSNSGVARNLRHRGVRKVVLYLLHSLPLPFPTSLFPFPPSLALNTLGGLGSAERYRFPQRGLGRSPNGNRNWCILALKSDIWWHQFY